MELREGMYVRTKEGKIFDCYVSEQMGKPIYYPKSSKTNGYIDYEEVYKKSKCIIDLIEVGDYVNGEKVTSAEPVDKNDTDRYLGFGDYDYYIHTSEDIKDVVTKEQFESMKYIVEE